MKIILVTVLLLFVAGCSTGRYAQKTDSKPQKIRPDIDFANPKPQYEPYAKATLRPYTVLGRRYIPLPTGKGYTATGYASWYGQKFHGHLTANGEIYDMFAMSAAHKTLPLPSYVRVTNLENGLQTIVRVNDRGPFHSKRIIDLSYAAALKLDLIDNGTAQVKLDILHVDENGVLTVGNQPEILNAPQFDSSQIAQVSNKLADSKKQSLFIQVAALQNKETVDKLADGLASLYQVGVHVPEQNGLYRLRLGPLDSEESALALLDELLQNGYSGAYKLYEYH